MTLASRGLRPAAVAAFRAAISSSPRALRRSKYFHISGSLIDISLANMSFAGSAMPIVLPLDFDIFSTPSMPSSSGIVMMHCGSCPYSACSARPTSRLNFWSVPPSSRSAFSATES